MQQITRRIAILAASRALQAELFAALRAKQEGAYEAVTQNLQAAMTAYGDLLVDTSRGLIPGQTNLSQADNFPTQPSRVVSVYFEGADEQADLSWLQLTNFDDFRGTTEDSMEIDNVRNGVSFRPYKNGEKVELFAVSGDMVKIPFELIGGGFQWLQTWLDDNKYWKLANGLAEAATQYAREMAENFYLTLTAAGYQTQARVVVANAPAGLIDILTVNAAYVAMLARLRANSNYGAANPRMYLVYNSLDADLATRAAQWGVAFTTADQGTVRINPNITVMSTPNVPAGGMWLVLPGRKIRTGNRMDMTQYNHFDPFTYSGARVFWGRYTHARADDDQVVFIPAS